MTNANKEGQPLYPGESEPIKAAVHIGLFSLAAMCLGYNSLAWSARKERHLLINIFIYGALAAYEGEQIRHHLTAAKQKE